MHAPDHERIADRVALTSVEPPSDDDSVKSYVTHCVPEDLIFAHYMEIDEVSLSNLNEDRLTI